jgi:hypothetical protein
MFDYQKSEWAESQNDPESGRKSDFDPESHQDTVDNQIMAYKKSLPKPQFFTIELKPLEARIAKPYQNRCHDS